MPDFDAIKARTRQVWSLGEYERIADLLAPAAQELLDAAAISAGQEVLDVAAGTGNLAVKAAYEGAAVVAADLSPRMVELGRARTEAEGYDVEWVEADAEELPFEDDRFDCAASVFGAVMAPQPDRVAGELFRVVRPGGTVALTAWRPGRFPSTAFRLVRERIGVAEGVPAPEEWGDEETARRRLEGLASSLRAETRVLRWEFASAADLADHFERYSPVNVAAREVLPEEVRDELRHEIVAAAEAAAAPGDGGLAFEAEYLLVVARKRG